MRSTWVVILFHVSVADIPLYWYRLERILQCSRYFFALVAVETEYTTVLQLSNITDMRGTWVVSVAVLPLFWYQYSATAE